MSIALSIGRSQRVLKIKIKYDTTFNCKINWFLASAICGLEKVVSELFRSVFEYLYGGATGTRKNQTNEYKAQVYIETCVSHMFRNFVIFSIKNAKIKASFTGISLLGVVMQF